MLVWHEESFVVKEQLCILISVVAALIYKIEKMTELYTSTTQIPGFDIVL